jgi:hypothetical protein
MMSQHGLNMIFPNSLLDFFLNSLEAFIWRVHGDGMFIRTMMVLIVR